MEGLRRSHEVLQISRAPRPDDVMLDPEFHSTIVALWNATVIRAEWSMRSWQFHLASFFGIQVTILKMCFSMCRRMWTLVQFRGSKPPSPEPRNRGRRVRCNPTRQSRLLLVEKYGKYLPCLTSLLCHHARHRHPAADGNAFHQCNASLVTPEEKAASGPASRAVASRGRQTAHSLHTTLALAFAASKLLSCPTNERRAFDKSLTCFEVSQRTSKGGMMALGSAELAPMFYFTPIAIHFAGILKLTEPVCGPLLLIVSSSSPSFPYFISCTSTSFIYNHIFA